MRGGDEISYSFGLLHVLVGNRQPGRVPRCHAAGKYTDRLKSFPAQQLCRSDRAALLVSDGDDSPCTVGLKLIKPAVQLGQGDEHRLFNVARFPTNSSGLRTSRTNEGAAWESCSCSWWGCSFPDRRFSTLNQPTC